MSGIDVSGVNCWASNGTRQLETRTMFTLAFSFASRNQALVAKGNISYTNESRTMSDYLQFASPICLMST
jgi:hypothetical protein